jgi:hypothetical protein
MVKSTSEPRSISFWMLGQRGKNCTLIPEEIWTRSDPSMLLITVLRSMHSRIRRTQSLRPPQAGRNNNGFSLPCCCCWRPRFSRRMHLYVAERSSTSRAQSRQVAVHQGDSTLGAGTALGLFVNSIETRSTVFARVWLAEVSSFDRIAGSSSTFVSRSFFSLKTVGL